MVKCKRCGEEGHVTWECRKPASLKGPPVPEPEYPDPGPALKRAALKSSKLVEPKPEEAGRHRPGECPCCDAVRARTLKRVALHRSKK